MDVTPIIPKGSKAINSYGEGVFTINEQKFSGNIFLQPAKAETLNSQHSSLEEFIEQTLAEISTSNIEIMLIGTGKSHIHLPPTTINKLNEKHQISIDLMSTGAACRTYNILLGEERKVAAILIAV